MQKFSQTAIFLQRKERKKLHAIANAKLVATLRLCYKNRSDFATSLRKLVLLVSVA